MGKGFAECHHVVPLADLGRQKRTRLEDLAIVCANCHRMIKSYFRKTQQFCSHGFLALEDLRGHLTMAHRLKMLFEIIEPFERARKADYNRDMLDFYDDLHRGELERPGR